MQSDAFDAFRPRTNPGGPSARAFTLIEVTAVLALTAILAAAAGVALAGPRARAVAADAVDQLAYADASVRRTAVDHPQTFTIDLSDGQLSRSEGGGPLVTLAELPAGVRVTRVLVGGDVIDFGQAQIAMSAGGRSGSYAVGLSTPAGPRWVVVAGLTGQVIAVADASAAEAAVDVVQPRANAMTMHHTLSDSPDVWASHLRQDTDLVQSTRVRLVRRSPGCTSGAPSGGHGSSGFAGIKRCEAARTATGSTPPVVGLRFVPFVAGFSNQMRNSSMDDAREGRVRT